MITEFVVSPGERTKRLDAFLASHERNVSRSRLQRLIVAGRIRVNSKTVKPSLKLKPGDWISMDTPQPGPMKVMGKIVPLEIIFEDSSLLVVNKPAGVVVHPTAGNWTGTLLNSLLDHLQGNRTCKQDLVHRLDKCTSGLMVVAKTSAVHQILCAQFEKHSITRRYIALVNGCPPENDGSVELPIGRDAAHSKRVSGHSTKLQFALTAYRMLERFGSAASLLELTPHTGRKHQLRVHMASIGCPIIGDEIYGSQFLSMVEGVLLPRMFLHASALGFRHPLSHQWMEFFLEIPPEMKKVLEILKTPVFKPLATA